MSTRTEQEIKEPRQCIDCGETYMDKHNCIYDTGGYDEEPDMGDVDRGYHIGDFTQTDIEEFKSEYRETGCPNLKELIDEREDWEKEWEDKSKERDDLPF